MRLKVVEGALDEPVPGPESLTPLGWALPQAVLPLMLAQLYGAADMAAELGTLYQWGLSSGVLGRGQDCSWELPTAEGVAFGSENRGANRQVPVSHVLRTRGAGYP